MVILRKSVRSVRLARILYLLGSLLCLVLLSGAFIAPAAVSPIPVGLDVVLFLARLILIVSATYLLLMSLLFFKKERHALNGTLACLELLLDSGGLRRGEGEETIEEEVGLEGVKVEVEE